MYILNLGYSFFYLFESFYISSMRLFTFKNINNTDSFLTKSSHSYSSFIESVTKFFMPLRPIIESLENSYKKQFFFWRTTKRFRDFTKVFKKTFLVYKYKRLVFLGSFGRLPIFELINWLFSIPSKFIQIVLYNLFSFWNPLRKGFINFRTTRSNTFVSFHTIIPITKLRDYRIYKAFFGMAKVVRSYIPQFARYSRQFVQFNVYLTKSVGSLGFKKKGRRSYDGNGKMIAFLKTSFEPFLISSMLDWFFIKLNGFFKITRIICRNISKSLVRKFRKLKYLWRKYHRQRHKLFNFFKYSDKDSINSFVSLFYRNALETPYKISRVIKRLPYTTFLQLAAPKISLRFSILFSYLERYKRKVHLNRTILRMNQFYGCIFKWVFRRRFYSFKKVLRLSLIKIVLFSAENIDVSFYNPLFNVNQYKCVIRTCFFFVGRYGYSTIKHIFAHLVTNVQMSVGSEQHHLVAKKPVRKSFQTIYFLNTFKFEEWFKLRLELYQLVVYLPRFFTIHECSSYPFNGCRRIRHYSKSKSKSKLKSKRR